MEINTGNPDGSWSISFNDPTGNVLSDNEFGHVGIGISVYDRELNQSSASIITRIRGVHAP
ncbi:MAG TPA: hypothetical protein PLO51_02950 [Candidatus Micrarchaeota archaeon]|nr:hypothetical protein [Candidatus Micrarchaeota archaeon]